jgi:AbrB family looped-hinge helix DNA binding protein
MVPPCGTEEFYHRGIANALYLLLTCRMMSQVTLSAKNQIVIPREAREALRVKAGDKLLVVVRGDRVIVLQKPKTWHAAIRGLGTSQYPDGYLQKERESWD